MIVHIAGRLESPYKVIHAWEDARLARPTAASRAEAPRRLSGRLRLFWHACASEAAVPGTSPP
jgi:hypothetical protein